MSYVPVVSIAQVYLYIYCARGASLQVLRSTYICPLHIYAALKSVDLTLNDALTETLTSVTRCQRSEQTAAERWAHILLSGSLAWRKVRQHRPSGRDVTLIVHYFFFTHKICAFRKQGRVRLLGGCTSTSVHFFFFRPGTIWFNECSTENERALYYSLWLNLSAPYNTQFILLYHLLHWNVLRVNSSPSPPLRDLFFFFFYQWTLITATQMGHGWRASDGNSRKRFCVERLGRDQACSFGLLHPRGFFVSSPLSAAIITWAASYAIGRGNCDNSP